MHKPVSHISASRPTRARKRLALSSKSGGASLVEVMVAASVMVFALCSSFFAFNRGYEIIDKARCGSLAGQILQSEIERIRLMSWADVSSSTTLPSGTVAIDTAYTSDPWIASRFSTLTRTVSVDSTRGTADISLSISWKGYNNAPYSRTFKTHYYKSGLYDFYYTRAKS